MGRSWGGPVAGLRHCGELHIAGEWLAKQQAAARALDLPHHPEVFIERFLGAEMWDKQREILDSVWEYRQTWVPTGHGIGKTWLLAHIGLAWMNCFAPLFGYKDALVAIFGAKAESLEKGVWAEVRRAHANAVIPLGGKMQFHDYKPWPMRHPKNWMGFFGAKKENVETVQGKHAECLLVMVEEGSGLEDQLLAGMESCATSRMSRLLVVGNPIKLSGPFYERCIDPRNPELKRKKMRNIIHVSSLETPNYVEGEEVIPGLATREWVEEQREKWGEDSPLYQSRVLGVFPQCAENAVFPLSAVEAACSRGDNYEIAPNEDEKVMAMDIARQGADMSVILGMSGDVVTGICARHTPNTIVAADWYHMTWKDWGGTSAIDENGLGGGPFDYLRSKYYDMHLRGFVSQRKARRDDRFANLKSEVAWDLRERMIDGNYAIPDIPLRDKLKYDLLGYLWEIDTKGRIKLVDPARSPDFGDTAIMAHWRQRSSGLAEFDVVVGHRESIASKAKDF